MNLALEFAFVAKWGGRVAAVRQPLGGRTVALLPVSK
jgi:hypothetical protein